MVRQWGGSSAGRAPRSQCGGREFDPHSVHHPIPYETRLAQCLAGFSFQQAVGQFVALAGGELIQGDRRVTESPRLGCNWVSSIRDPGLSSSPKPSLSGSVAFGSNAAARYGVNAVLGGRGCVLFVVDRIARRSRSRIARGAPKALRRQLFHALVRWSGDCLSVTMV